MTMAKDGGNEEPQSAPSEEILGPPGVPSEGAESPWIAKPAWLTAQLEKYQVHRAGSVSDSVVTLMMSRDGCSAVVRI